MISGTQLADMIFASIECADCSAHEVCAKHLEFFAVALRLPAAVAPECESCHTLRNQLQTALVRVRLLEKASGQVPDDRAVHAQQPAPAASTGGQPFGEEAQD